MLQLSFLSCWESILPHFHTPLSLTSLGQQELQGASGFSPSDGKRGFIFLTYVQELFGGRRQIHKLSSHCTCLLGPNSPTCVCSLEFSRSWAGRPAGKSSDYSEGRAWAAPVRPPPREFWQHTTLTLYFNSSQGKLEPAKGGGRQDIPHPPIWTGDTFCLGERSHPGLCRLSCLPPALPRPFLALRGCLSTASLSPASRHSSCSRGPPGSLSQVWFWPVQVEGWVMQSSWCLAESFLPQKCCRAGSFLGR